MAEIAHLGASYAYFRARTATQGCIRPGIFLYAERLKSCGGDFEIDNLLSFEYHCKRF